MKSLQEKESVRKTTAMNNMSMMMSRKKVKVKLKRKLRVKVKQERPMTVEARLWRMCRMERKEGSLGRKSLPEHLRPRSGANTE